MKERKDKSKVYMIISITTLIIAIIGSTYAYYRFVMTSVNVNTITRGLDYYINYAKGTDITSGTLNPSKDYTDGNNITVTLNKKDNTYNIYGHIYLDISNISTALSSSNALKYVVLEGTTKISEGVLGEVSSGESYLLAVNIPLKTTTTTYTIYLWFDEASSNASTAENTSVSAKVRCEATMQEIDDEAYTFDAAAYIKSLYNKNTKTSVVSNNVTYQYNKTSSLMKDVGGNIRYYGASPNNYIYFNCSDYSNQTDSTCEKWRIIGLVDGKVKLIRNESIGAYSFDNRGTASGANTDYGSNDWTTSRLMKLLNSGYESETGGSLYWNRTSGNCYSGESVDKIKTCDLSGVGLKNDTTKRLISETIWSLLTTDNLTIYADQMYNYERTTGRSVDWRPTSWKGKVGLLFASDYAYSADLSLCKDSSGGDLALNLFADSNNDYACRNNNWLYAGTYRAMISPSAWEGNNQILLFNSKGRLNDYYAYAEYPVCPTIYLKRSIEIKTGDGSSNSPYQLKVV